MKSLKEFKGELKEKCTKKNLLTLLECSFYTYFFLQMSVRLCYGTEAEFQMVRDGFNYEAIAYLLGIIIVATRAEIWHWIPGITGFLYGSGCIIYLHQMAFEDDMFRAMGMKLLSYGLFGILIIDIIRRKQYVKWKERNVLLTLFLIFSVLFAWIFCKGASNTVYFLCPFAILYCVRISEKKWKQLLLCFSIAYVTGAAFIFIKSLIKVPYTGGRYWGTFLNLSTISLFLAGAIICGLFWLLLKKVDRWKPSWRMLPIAFAVMGGSAAIFMVSARTAMLGVICACVFAMIFFPAKTDSGVIRKRGLIVAGSVLGALVVGVGILWGMSLIDKETLKESIENETIYRTIAYWYERAKTMFNAKSRVFEHGTLLAMIDRFASGRLGIWVEYISCLNLFGHEGTYLQEIKPHRTDAHNTYISFLYNYGIISGGGFICWYITLFVNAVKKALSGKEVYLFSVLWIVFAMAGMMTDTMFWIYPIQFVLLLVQYPLLINIEKKEKETNAES